MRLDRRGPFVNEGGVAGAAPRREGGPTPAADAAGGGAGRAAGGAGRAAARLIAREAGAAALARAVPLVAALGIAAAVVMGPTGLHPADVVAAADGSRAVRAALWVLWLVATAPAMIAALTCRELVYVRALPVARWVWWTVLAGVALAVALPWAGLFWAGGGAARGGAAGLGAAGLAASAPVALGLVGRMRLVEGVAVAAAAAAVVAAVIWSGGAGWGAGVVAGAGAGGDATLAAAGALALAVAIPLGWRRGTELARARQARRLIRGPAPVALALALVAALARSERGALVRGGLCALLAGAIAGLARMGPYAGAAVALLALGCAAFGLSAPLARADRALRWLCDASGATAEVRFGASALVAAVWGAIGGMLFAASAHAAGPGSTGSARLVALAPGLGVALGLAAAAGARLADREGGVDGVRAVLVGAAVVGGGLVALAALAARAGGG